MSTPTPLELGSGQEIDVNQTWRQIGRQLLAELGAHNLAYARDYVQFDLRGTHIPHRQFIVQLAPSDTYNIMIGYLCRTSFTWIPLAVEHDIHVESLRERLRALYTEHA